MELVYKNSYGACYKTINPPNQNCEFQLIINTVGIFMTKKDISNLLKIVKDYKKNCKCEGNKNHRIWCKNPIVDIGLKINDEVLYTLKDLLKGTLIMLEIEETLQKHKLI